MMSTHTIDEFIKLLTDNRELLKNEAVNHSQYKQWLNKIEWNKTKGRIALEKINNDKKENEEYEIKNKEWDKKQPYILKYGLKHGDKEIVYIGCSDDIDKRLEWPAVS